MSTFSPERLPGDPDRLALRKDAQATLTAYKAFVEDPAFTHRIDLKVLVKIAGDDSMPVRERRRAAEVLGTFYLKAMQQVSDLGCVREQMLRHLGLEDGPKAVSLTQVNTKIEIVRKDDWRAATVDFKEQDAATVEIEQLDTTPIPDVVEPPDEPASLG